MRKETTEVYFNGSFRKSDAETEVKPFNCHR
jgi:hypothetical protein